MLISMLLLGLFQHLKQCLWHFYATQIYIRRSRLTHTLYPFPPHPHPVNKARYPPIAHIKE
ncbi:hypothetical protein CCL22_10540 [Pseudomonas syringae]|nr:hypothetical protein CCL22_10540 [Pseudomonas syringae]